MEYLNILKTKITATNYKAYKLLGNPCEDLCRILNLNTTGEYRRQNTENIMKYYMERIKEYAGNGVTFSFDQV